MISKGETIWVGLEVSQNVRYFPMALKYPDSVSSKDQAQD